MSKKSKDAHRTPLEGADQDRVEKHLPLKAPVIYEVVRQEGETELRRPVFSLWWSGIAAGIAIFASVAAEGMLRQHLPDQPWRPLIENIGYSVGFIIVILGRLQLFTENTITAVLPLLARWSSSTFLRTARLWGVVLLANVVGTTLVAGMVLFAGMAPAPYVTSMIEVSRELLHLSAAQAFLYGIPAGFLVAAIVWLLPNAEASKFQIVFLLTYVIALGDLTHVIAGSGEVMLLIFAGELNWLAGIGGLLGPILIGNIIGGTGLFALLAYGQIREEF